VSANTVQKLQHELNSLQGLSIINIVAAAMALAFGAYFAMPTLITIATTLTVEITQIGLVVLGLIAFVAGIRWLVSCAEMIDAGSDISESLKEHKKNGTIDDDTLTGLIVKMTATYRENKPALKMMINISKVAGVCFALLSVYTLVTLITGVLSGVALWTTITLIVSLGINLAIAVACFIIPKFFSKYTIIWDKRLEEAAKAEEELKKQLGEA
jgi:amino acid transporter